MKKLLALATVTLALAACNLSPVADENAPSANIYLDKTTLDEPRSVILTSSPTDDVGVTRVEFYKNGTLIATDTTAPFSTIDTPTNVPPFGITSYVYNTRAYDAAGNIGVSGDARLLIIRGDPAFPSDTTPPTVELYAPTFITNAGTYTLAAQATDNLYMSRVEFYQGTTLLATDRTEPYQASFDVTSANNGTLTFTAKAYDYVGHVTTSAAQTVTVSITARSGGRLDDANGDAARRADTAPREGGAPASRGAPNLDARAAPE